MCEDFLPEADGGLSAAQQVRQMGLKVGDTIVGREETSDDWWHEARLTLVWLGKRVAVWNVQSRTFARRRWIDEGESASWTLDARQWRRVSDAETT